MGASFIGQGVAFPLHADSTGALALVGEVRELEEAIRLILATTPGERPMRPEFGSDLAEYVYAPADAAPAGRLAHAVRVALERWEPRIDLDSVDVLLGAAQEGVLYIDIGYRVRGTYDPRNLVFPFYVIPDHGRQALAGEQVPAAAGVPPASTPATASPVPTMPRARPQGG